MPVVNRERYLQPPVRKATGGVSLRGRVPLELLVLSAMIDKLRTAADDSVDFDADLLRSEYGIGVSEAALQQLIQSLTDHGFLITEGADADAQVTYQITLAGVRAVRDFWRNKRANMIDSLRMR